MLIVKEGTNGWEGTDDATKKLIAESLQKEGFTVRTADQDKTYVAAQAQPAIDEAFQKRNQQLENTIREKSGIEKLNINEKYFDYFTRVMDLKTTELTALQGKVAEFEKSGTNGNALAEGYKKQVDTLQLEIKTLRKDFETKIEEKDGLMFKNQIDANVSAAIDKLKGFFRGDIAEEFVSDIVRARRADFESQFTAKEIGGIIVLHDKDGKPVMSKQDGKPVSIDEKLKETFASYLDEKKAQGGAGSGKPNPTNNGGKGADGKDTPKWKETELPTTVKSKPGLVKWLTNDMKIAAGTKDYDDAYLHFSKRPDGTELAARETAVNQ